MKFMISLPAYPLSAIGNHMASLYPGQQGYALWGVSGLTASEDEAY